MKKTNLIITIIILICFIASIALAQEIEGPKAGTTPDSPFYFLERISEGIGTFFTFGDLKKAERYADLAAERLAEVQALAEKGKSEKAEKTLARYEKQLERALAKAEKAKTKGKNVERVVEIVAEATGKHLVVLEGVLEKVPEKAKVAVAKAKEVSMNGQKNALRALAKEKPERATEINLKAVEARLNRAEVKVEEGKIEEAKEAIEEFENQHKFGKEISQIAQGFGKDTTIVEQLVGKATSKHLEVLAEVYEKVPEQAKPAIEKAMGVSIRGHEKAVRILRARDALGGVSEITPMPEEIPEEVKERIRKKIEEEDVGCIEEGRGAPGVAVSPEGFESLEHMATECCEGLKEIYRSEELDEDCNVEPPVVGVIGGRTVCSNCGNGICEAWETECNCPEDCKITVKEEEKEIICIGKGGETWAVDPNCCEGLEVVTDCLPDEPCPISLRYCVDCGNGACEAHENWYNCPEDCSKTAGDCEKITDSTKKDTCYYFVAIEVKDANPCEKITNSDKKNSCYTDIAIETKDSSLCEKITESSWKDSCYTATTSDWKTYTNTKYGFELEYPENLNVIQEGKGPGGGYVYSVVISNDVIQKKVNGLEIYVYSKDVPHQECPGFNPSVLVNGKKVVREELNHIWKLGTEVMIGDYAAIKILAEDEFKQEGLQYVFQRDGYDYLICIGIQSNIEDFVEENIPQFNQILSTFKFIE